MNRGPLARPSFRCTAPATGPFFCPAVEEHRFTPEPRSRARSNYPHLYTWFSTCNI